mgnify:CR=1 FL=1
MGMANENKHAHQGFTLVELLITIIIIGIVAVVTVPFLSSNDPKKLSVATQETANLLRFAMNEARRTNGYVLVDGATTPGHLILYQSTATAEVPPVAGTSVINDPLTKRHTDLDVNNNAFSGGVTLTPQFQADGQALTRLLIGPGLSALQGFDDTNNNQGNLQANSGVLLSYGSQSATVTIDHVVIGKVDLP